MSFWEISCVAVGNLRKQQTFCDGPQFFPCKMRSEERAQKFHTDVVPLPKSGYHFSFFLPRAKFIFSQSEALLISG